MPDLRTGRQGNLYVQIGASVTQSIRRNNYVTKIKKEIDKKGVDSTRNTAIILQTMTKRNKI